MKKTKKKPKKNKKNKIINFIILLLFQLINSAESESNCLRRELLISRLRNAVRRSVRPTSSDA